MITAIATQQLSNITAAAHCDRCDRIAFGETARTAEAAPRCHDCCEPERILVINVQQLDDSDDDDLQLPVTIFG